MYFIIALILHLLGVHTPKPYSVGEDEDLDKQGKFK